ncbi:MAG: glycosyltransferase family 4 protein [Planctomycetota bacterium]|jgi:glycosyltransferase involved in cell wall biosynthesis
MKICFLSIGDFDHLQSYIDFFASGGHEVYLVALRPSPPRGIKVYDVSLGRYDKDSDKWKYLVSALRARRLIKKLKPDIVHAQYATSAGMASLIVNHPATIVTAHGSDLTCGSKSRLWRPLLKKIFRQAACVNVVSDDLKQMAIELGVSKKKIAVINMGIDSDVFSFKARDGFDKFRPIKLINTRRLESVYDHPTIVNALEILKNRGVDFHMTFVGYGELQSELMTRVDKKGLGGKVCFLGGVPNERMPSLLHHNDVYLSASLWDGASLCLLEAMATGIFPVVSDIPANSDWIKSGRNGFLHPVGDAAGIADCIQKVIAEPEIMTYSAKKNRCIVLDRGSRNNNMKKLEDIYKRLAAREQP